MPRVWRQSCHGILFWRPFRSVARGDGEALLLVDEGARAVVAFHPLLPVGAAAGVEVEEPVGAARRQRVDRGERRAPLLRLERADAEAGGAEERVDGGERRERRLQEDDAAAVAEEGGAVRGEAAVEVRAVGAAVLVRAPPPSASGPGICGGLQSTTSASANCTRSAKRTLFGGLSSRSPRLAHHWRPRS